MAKKRIVDAIPIGIVAMMSIFIDGVFLLTVSTTMFHLLCTFSYAQIPSREMKYVHRCSKDVTSNLTAAPSYDSRMPKNVSKTYQLIDKLCIERMSTEYQEVLHTMAVRQSSVTVDSVAKYLYQTMDYDPLLFYKYMYHGRFLRPDYVNPPDVLFTAFRHLLMRSKDKLKLYLAHAAGVYYVKIRKVEQETVHSGGGKRIPQNVVCLTAEVLETIKGASLVKQVVDPENGNSMNILLFSYAREWETLHREISTDVSMVIEGFDGKILNRLPRYDDLPLPQVGDEYIVVLDVYMASHTGPNGTEYFLVASSGSQPEGGLFKIEEDGVFDSTNFFGFGMVVDVQEFVHQVRELIHSAFYSE